MSSEPPKFVVPADFYDGMVERWKRVPASDADADQAGRSARMTVDRDFAPVVLAMALEFAEACERYGPLARDLVRRLGEAYPGVEAMPMDGSAGQ